MTSRKDELSKWREDAANAIHRRTFLARSGVGIGSAALGSLWMGTQASGQQAQTLSLPHFPPRIKRVIFLCMAGGPSHLETFDF